MIRIKDGVAGETAYKIPKEPAAVVKRLPRDQDVVRRSSIAFMTEGRRSTVASDATLLQ